MRLLLINVLWVAVAWLLIPAGPATLAAYWFIARSMRDDEPLTWKDLFRAVGRFFWRGLVWFLGLVLVLYLAYLNMVVWGRILSPFGASLVQLAWLYLLIFVFAMQPYLLEALTVEEEGLNRAIRRAAWQVMANPVYSHLQLVIPVVAIGVAYKTTTVAPFILIAVSLAFMVVAAVEVPWKYGERRPNDPRMEDLL